MYSLSGSEDIKYMERCLVLAENGIGHVSPNPMVGCVIVRDGRIIGEGYHIIYGGPHAEVNAIHAVKDKGLLRTSTMYVSLEPCSHWGKTPPCADKIIEHGIPKVVIGCRDINEEVAGRGIEKLQNAGIEVVYGVLEKECIELNKRFFTFYRNRRPYIILKWAQTTDGFIARNDNSSNWISNTYSRMLVHQWRGQEDAIMAGSNTIRIDNPYLTTREMAGKNPARIIIDRNLDLPKNLNVLNDESKTIVFNAKESLTKDNIEYVKVDFKEDILPGILNELYVRKIQSVIIEGGAKLLNSFINSRLWDEARVFISPTLFGDGIAAPVIPGKVIEKTKITGDVLLICNNEQTKTPLLQNEARAF